MAGTPLTDAIEALTTYSNTVTGASDTTLSEAVATLAAGYGGGGWTADGLATNTEPNGIITLGSNVTAINEYAFYKRPITSISGENVVTVGQYACAYTNVATCRFPNATTIGKEAFRSSQIDTCYLPNVTRIEGDAFKEAKLVQVTDAEFPALTSFLGGSFALNHQLQKVFLSFRGGCDAYVFDGCENLEVVVFPNSHSTGRYACRNCYKLRAYDTRGNHTAATRVNDHCFINDPLFDTLIYGGNRLPILDLNAFDGTPFASNGTGGKLYVRQDMIASFQSAANWSTLLSYPNNQILAIEGSYYETHYADGTPIT